MMREARSQWPRADEGVAAQPWRADLLWLAVVLLLLFASGIGWRSPWPADEPRFALIARDMVRSGNWLFPRVGGALYADKPPLFFWLLAAAYAATGSIRWSFLLPSLCAASGTVLLVYDLARRLTGRRAALCAALLLAVTVQFVLVGRRAQIDATLVLFTTLSLYGLLRHLLLGPAWGWYFIGALAAGLGVITKGVGFLPLLILLPYLWQRLRGYEPLPRIGGDARWALGAAGLLLGVALWLVPMLIAVALSPNPALAHYRHDILFHQTVGRYAASWQHIHPWYFFAVNVIPALWIPLSPLLIWLVPRWREALRARAAHVWLPLAWALMTLVFFSLSPGKRGIYILPALPAVALAAAPYLPDLYRRAGVRRLGLALAALPLLAALVLLGAWLGGVAALHRVARQAGLAPLVPLALFAVAGLGAWCAAWRWRALLAWPAVLACLALVWGYGIAPQLDGQRSGRTFMQAVQRRVPAQDTLGLMAYKEQFLLYLNRPIVNFGDRRWREGPAEAYDASRWLNAAPDRVLLVPGSQLNPCFTQAPRSRAGIASGGTWFLVRAPAAADCARQGNADHVLRYDRLSR